MCLSLQPFEQPFDAAGTLNDAVFGVIIAVTFVIALFARYIHPLLWSTTKVAVTPLPTCWKPNLQETGRLALL